MPAPQAAGPRQDHRNGNATQNIHAHAFELRHLHAVGRQGFECRFVQLLEGAQAVAGQLLEGPRVMVNQKLGDRPVEFTQAEEALIAQARQNPAFDQEHAILDFGFVARVRRACRQDRRGVVLTKLLQQPVGAGLVAVGVGDQRTRLVGHQQARDTSIELQRRDDGAHPILCRLGARGARVGVVGGAQRRHEDLCLGDLPRGGVHDGHGLPGVVHKHLLAGHMRLAHRAFERLGPGGVFDAERGVLVGYPLVLLLVLLPQQLQGDAGALELAVNPVVVGFELARTSSHRRAVQPPLQFVVRQALGYEPVHAGGARIAGDLGDGGFRNVQRLADLPSAERGFVKKLKCMSEFAHVDPWCWHRRLRLKKPGSVCQLRSPEPPCGVSAFSLKCCPPSP
jgi:hypothetical protein